MCDGGEERIMTNLKGFEPLPAYLLRVSLRCFFFNDFPMGYMSLMISQCYPVGFGYILLLPNEEDSIDSVLVCNPSGKEIPALA